MNKLVPQGIHLQIQMDSYEIFLKPKVEKSMIWGDVVLKVVKPVSITGTIDLEFSGVCETYWPQGLGRTNEIYHTRDLHRIQVSLPPPISGPRLDTGTYHLPFEFPIPSTLPSTTKLKNGNISYKLTVHLRKSGVLFQSVCTTVPIYLIQFPRRNPWDMRYVSAERHLDGVCCHLGIDCAAIILGHFIGVDVTMIADSATKAKVKSVILTITEKSQIQSQQHKQQSTDHTIVHLKWAYHHNEFDLPYTNCPYTNLKELNWDLGTPLQARFVYPIPSCQFLLQPSVNSADISITHWAKLTISIEKDGETMEAMVETPLEVLSCRLVPELTEPPPKYEEYAAAEVAVQYEHNAGACPCTRKDDDRKLRGRTTIARLLPRYQPPTETDKHV
ncbi:hypothetical protein NQZ79_g5328 [Umbelopsis isabellina]|nr:hypothetical protein NQZ79_g5328 [Umbelopsis isabellina]